MNNFKWYKVKVACYNSCIYEMEVVVRSADTEAQAGVMVLGLLMTKLDAFEIISTTEIEDPTRE